MEDTRPRVGGEGVGDSLWRGWPESRGPGSSAMIQSELLWSLIFRGDPFGVSLDIDIGWILRFYRIISTFVRQLVLPYEKLVYFSPE